MKNISNYLPAYLLLLYTLGLLTQFYFSIFTKPFQGVVLIILFFVLSRWFFKRAELFVFFLLGMFFMYGLRSPKGHFKRFENAAGEVSLRIHSTLKLDSTKASYMADVLSFDAVKSKGKVLLRIERDSAVELPEIHDLVFAHAKFQKLPKKKNPHDFDYGAYLQKKNIQAQIFLKKNSYHLKKEHRFNLRKWARRQRLFLQTKLRKTLKNKEVVAMTETMLLGDKSLVSKEILMNYAQAGVLHILAISGLHVGILLWLLNFLYRPLLLFKYGNGLRLVLVILSLWLFALLVGLTPSVVRAVTMFSFVGLARSLSTRISVLQSLVSSAFVLLLCNPFYLFNVGFQLSYLAVVCIVLIQPFLVRWWKPRCKLFDGLWRFFTVSVAAQIGVMPLSLYYFHQFPSLFVVSNLVVVPCIGIVLSLGFLVLLCAVYEWFFTILIAFYSQTILLLNRFIAWVARQETYLFDQIYFPLIYVWASYLSIVLMMAFMETKKKSVLFAFMGSVFLFFAMHQWVKYDNQQKEAFVVFQRYKSSLFLKKCNGKIEVFTNSKTKDSIFLKNYIRESFPLQSVFYSKIQDFYHFQKQEIQVVAGSYRLKEEVPNSEILVLKNSPKVNLERLLQKTKSRLVVVDGSNYPSFKKRWRKTCRAMDVLFYDTAKEGAFVLQKKIAL